MDETQNPINNDFGVTSPDEGGVRVMYRDGKNYLVDDEMNIQYEILAQTGVELSKWNEQSQDFEPDMVNIFIIKYGDGTSRSLYGAYRRLGNTMIFSDGFMKLLKDPHESTVYFLPPSAKSDYALAHELAHYHIENRVSQQERDKFVKYFQQNRNYFENSMRHLLNNETYRSQIINNTKHNLNMGKKSHYFNLELEVDGQKQEYVLDGFEILAELLAHELLFSKFITKPEDQENFIRFVEADNATRQESTSGMISLQAHYDFKPLREQYSGFDRMFRSITGYDNLNAEIDTIKRTLLGERIGDE